MARAKSGPSNEADAVELYLPAVEEISGGMPHRVEVNLYEAGQRMGLTRLYHALVKDGAKLGNGKPVASLADVVRYVLDQYEAKCVGLR